MNIFVKYFLQYFLLKIRDIFATWRTPQEISILCYHSISDVDNNTAINPEVFERQLEMLKKTGIQFVSTRDIVEWINGNLSLPKRSVAITFDDGYTDFETNALPILEKFKVPTTLFVVGDENRSHKQLGNDLPLLSKEAQERLSLNPLIEIGYHSMTHINLTKITTDKLFNELKNLLRIHYFAYPGGSYSKNISEVLNQLGYKAAFTIGWNVISKHCNIMYIPRSVILKNMPLWRVRFATTIALRWYRDVTKFFTL